MASQRHLDPAAPAARRRVWPWLVTAVILGALISLGRVDRPTETIWAEDGTYFYSDALGRPVLPTLVRPLAGYYVTMARLLAWPARYVPLQWGPVVLTFGAALVTGGLAVVVYLASRPYLGGWLGPLIVAAPVVAVPVGENLAATNTDNVATLQFIAIYATAWLLLWRPARALGRWLALGLVLLIAFSTFLVALLLPLAILRLFMTRDRFGLGMLGGLLFGAAANLIALHFGLTARPAFLVPNHDPLWALRHLFTYGLPTALFGSRINVVRNGHWTGYATVALLVLALVVVVAWRFCDPQWTIGLAFATSAAFVFCGSAMSAGSPELRYVTAPELLLFAACALLLRPRDSMIPLAVLGVFVLAVCVVSYRMPSGRTVEPRPWSALVAQARKVCQNPAYGAVYVYPSLPLPAVGIPDGVPPAETPPVGWPVRLPCAHLR